MSSHDRIRLSAAPSLILAAVLAVVGPAKAGQIRPVNLEEMTLRAARIFAGRCVASELEKDPNTGMVVAVATFEVHRTVKGGAQDAVTVRMIEGDDGHGGGTAGVPGFRPGDEAVLFLYGEGKSGLTSPVGLGQGRFTIITDKEGRQIARNEFANRNLLRGLTPAARERLGGAFEAVVDGPHLESATLLDLATVLMASGR